MTTRPRSPRAIPPRSDYTRHANPRSLPPRPPGPRPLSPTPARLPTPFRPDSATRHHGPSQLIPYRLPIPGHVPLPPNPDYPPPCQPARTDYTTQPAPRPRPSRTDLPSPPDTPHFAPSRLHRPAHVSLSPALLRPPGPSRCPPVPIPTAQAAPFHLFPSPTFLPRPLRLLPSPTTRPFPRVPPHFRLPCFHPSPPRPVPDSPRLPPPTPAPTFQASSPASRTTPDSPGHPAVQPSVIPRPTPQRTASQFRSDYPLPTIPARYRLHRPPRANSSRTVPTTPPITSPLVPLRLPLPTQPPPLRQANTTPTGPAPDYPAHPQSGRLPVFPYPTSRATPTPPGPSPRLPPSRHLHPASAPTPPPSPGAPPRLSRLPCAHPPMSLLPDFPARPHTDQPISTAPPLSNRPGPSTDYPAPFPPILPGPIPTRLTTSHPACPIPTSPPMSAHPVPHRPAPPVLHQSTAPRPDYPAMPHTPRPGSDCPALLSPCRPAPDFPGPVASIRFRLPRATQHDPVPTSLVPPSRHSPRPDTDSPVQPRTNLIRRANPLRPTATRLAMYTPTQRPILPSPLLTTPVHPGPARLQPDPD